MPDDEEDLTMGGMVGADGEEHVRVKCCSRDLRESCRAERSKLPERVVEAVSLAVELVGNAVVTSPGAV